MNVAGDRETGSDSDDRTDLGALEGLLTAGKRRELLRHRCLLRTPRPSTCCPEIRLAGRPVALRLAASRIRVVR